MVKQLWLLAHLVSQITGQLKMSEHLAVPHNKAISWPQCVRNFKELFMTLSGWRKPGQESTKWSRTCHWK